MAISTIDPENEFMLVVIYKNLPAYPEEFVARAQYIHCTTRVVREDKDCIHSTDYHELVKILKDMGLIRIRRHPEDDDRIVESWI